MYSSRFSRVERPRLRGHNLARTSLLCPPMKDKEKEKVGREERRKGRGRGEKRANSFFYKDNDINLLVRMAPMTFIPPIRSYSTPHCHTGH